MGYFIIYIYGIVSTGVIFFLAYGLPLLLAALALRNWQSPRRCWLYAGLLVLWALPSGVELLREQRLKAWIDTLPPAPIVQLAPATVLALDNGVFDAEQGTVYFGQCPQNRYQSLLCQFELGPDAQTRGLRIVIGAAGAWQGVEWVRQAHCGHEIRYTTQPEVYSAFFSAQGICPAVRATQTGPDTVVLRYASGSVPWHPGTAFGQITLSDAASGETRTTLTAFALERPAYPVLWGVNWLPILRPFLPRNAQTFRYGDVYDEDIRLGYPEGSLQRLVYNIGWDPQINEAEVLENLAQIHGFDADRAVPALASRSFFPTRFALETLCHPLFADRMTPAAAAEIRQIVADNPRFNNGLPNQLAKRAIESGCVP